MEGNLRSPPFPSAPGCLSEPAVLGAEGSLRPKSTLPCTREVLAWEGGMPLFKIEVTSKLSVFVRSVEVGEEVQGEPAP